MKKLHLLSIGLVLALTACGTPTVVKYHVNLLTSDTAKQIELGKATERMAKRRLEALSIKNAIVSVVPSGSGGATLSMTLADAGSVDAADHILMQPFTFDIRIQKAVPAGTASNAADEWIPTALTGSSLDWIQAYEASGTDKGAVVELTFNAKGREILQSVFRGSAGKDIGIFVRDVMVSKLKVGTEKIADHIIISGIPSYTVAQIFADDVNVGLHTTFEPLR